MPTFTINCPSCGNELTYVKKLFDAFAIKHQDSIPENSKHVLTRVPQLNKKVLIDALNLPSCCTAEVISRVDRTLLLYGSNYVDIPK